MKRYLTILVLLLVVDTTWLLLMSDFYSRHFVHLFEVKLNVLAAGFFYLVYSFGIFHLALGSKKPVVKAGILGLVAYGTYELTNMATVPAWPLEVVVVDMIWGGLLTSVVVYLTRKLHEK